MTLQRFLLDTSALLVHFRQELGWERVQALFEQEGTEILAASVSLTEFARRLRELGATPAGALQTVQDYGALLDDIVTVDEKVALEAFNLGCETVPRLPLVDALIAATARERDACLVHRDGHMAGIPGHLVTQLALARKLETE